jgi:hypothetical protein
MTGVAAVSAIPFAAALVLGVGGFAALIPFLIEESRTPARVRAPRAPVRLITPWIDRVPPLHGVIRETAMDQRPAESPVPVVVHHRISRVRLVVTVGTLVVWSVWSVRRPRQIGRHD